MITIQEALEIVRRNVPSPEIHSLPLVQAGGRILAEDLRAIEPSPRYTNSAMDGFAVRWEDVQPVARKGTVVELTLVGESQAGVPLREALQPGQAARINTGAMVPPGADTVIPVEETEIQGQKVRILKAGTRGQHLRYVGEEFQAGDPLLPQGALLDAPRLALLASQGIQQVPVYAPPVVSIVVTGTELVPYDRPVQPWQIRDSNSIMLAEAVRASGGQSGAVVRVEDDLERTVAALQQALEKSQLVLFSGGVSVGPHDLVKQAAEACGMETLFWRVNQKPGKPLFFARKGETLLFGLPGNPVSAYMCYIYYVHPVIRSLVGDAFGHRTISATVGEPLVNRVSRAQLFRVRWERDPRGNPVVFPLPRQGSHMLTSLTGADGFVVLEPGASHPAGETVEVIPFGRSCSIS